MINSTITTADENQLGTYLRDRRAKLNPAMLGLPSHRRRTPGLRREEVAQRANVSATWYTWLEQGRGGAPSADVLDRIARALMLTELEREHLFHIALGRPPEIRYKTPEPVTPRLQRVLDCFVYAPAYIKTSSWDVIGWNRAASTMLTDYGALPPEQRNILRQMFLGSHIRNAQTDWQAVARFAVAAFRADVARAGAAENVKALVDELSRLSPEFASIWKENDVRSGYSEVVKQIRHPLAGMIGLDYSTLSIDGRSDLDLVVYTPSTPEDRAKIEALIGASIQPAPA